MSQAGEQFHCVPHSSAAGHNRIGWYGNKHNFNQVVALCCKAQYGNLKELPLILGSVVLHTIHLSLFMVMPMSFFKDITLLS